MNQQTINSLSRLAASLSGQARVSDTAASSMFVSELTYIYRKTLRKISSSLRCHSKITSAVCNSGVTSTRTVWTVDHGHNHWICSVISLLTFNGTSSTRLRFLDSTLRFVLLSVLHSHVLKYFIFDRRKARIRISSGSTGSIPNSKTVDHTDTVGVGLPSMGVTIPRLLSPFNYLPVGMPVAKNALCNYSVLSMGTSPPTFLTTLHIR